MGLLEELEALQILKPGTATNTMTASLPDEAPTEAVAAGDEDDEAAALSVEPLQPNEPPATEPQFDNCLDSVRQLVERAVAAGAVA